jgi:hypothetical protein
VGNADVTANAGLLPLAHRGEVIRRLATLHETDVVPEHQVDRLGSYAALRLLQFRVGAVAASVAELGRNEHLVAHLHLCK